MLWTVKWISKKVSFEAKPGLVVIQDFFFQKHLIHCFNSALTKSLCDNTLPTPPFVNPPKVSQIFYWSLILKFEQNSVIKKQ